MTARNSDHSTDHKNSDTDGSRLLGPLPITDRDADRLDEIKGLINDIGGCRVRETDYGKAFLGVELTDVDDETAQSRTEQINEEYRQLLEHDDRHKHRHPQSDTEQS